MQVKAESPLIAEEKTMAAAIAICNAKKRVSVVPNFRGVPGLKNFYRCSAPDNLADMLNSEYLLDNERFILYEATLVVDLRSESEVESEKSRLLMENAPGGRFQKINSVEEMSNSNERRQILRLRDYSVSRQSVTDYVIKNWVPEALKASKDESELQTLMFSYFNERGLSGLLEIILETKGFICATLQSITIHLERNNDGKIILHCNLGKDRAGIIAMLCASIVGVSDENIIEDFTKSSCVLELAERKYIMLFKGHAEPARFAHADAKAIVHAFKYLRENYGSVDGYLDSTGFDSAWRGRFLRVAS